MRYLFISPMLGYFIYSRNSATLRLMLHILLRVRVDYVANCSFDVIYGVALGRTLCPVADVSEGHVTRAVQQY
jgi:hypothetical protein